MIIPSTNNLIKEERMQLRLGSEMTGGKKVSRWFGARRSMSDVLPVSLVRRHPRDSRSFGQVNLTNQLNPVHAEVKMLAENVEIDEGSTNLSVKKCAKVDQEKGPANDDVCTSTFQPFSSYQEIFEEKFHVPNSSRLGFHHQNLHYGPKHTSKGKEKVICEKENTTKESDDSNGSAESTNSIVSKRKRPWLFSNNLKNTGVKNKRLRTERNESSFMNWISTIANGFASCSQPTPVTPISVARQLRSDEKGPSSSTQMSQENRANGRTLLPFKPIGFSGLFHALYRQNITISLHGKTSSSERSSRHEDHYGLNANNTDPSQDEIRPNNPNTGWACMVQTQDGIRPNSPNTRRACMVQTMVQSNSTSNNESRVIEEKRNMAARGGYLENIWITRLLPKDNSSSPPPIENDAFDLNKEANECFDKKRDQKLKANVNPILPSSKNRQSEAIVSLFARRLGVIRHAEPLNSSYDKNQWNLGERMEGPSSPNNDRRMVLLLGDKDRNVNEANEERNIRLMEVGSHSAENCGINGNSGTPYHNFSTDGAISEKLAIFEAVRRLRLSRVEVVRLLNSQIQRATLDGFFLRVRLGKLNGAVSRSGYYAARINGLSGEKSLSVSIGSSTYLVECHCISNQDFLEDELKAWFDTALKGDFRLISWEELDKKLKEKDLMVLN